MQVNELKEISDQYRDILRLDGTPVAVKLFKEPIELKGIVAKKPDKYRRHLCQKISKARYVGRTNFLNPAEDCQVIPDVVVFQGNVGQMIAILRGYFHNKKEGLTIDTTSLAACADAIIAQSVDVRYS